MIPSHRSRLRRDASLLGALVLLTTGTVSRAADISTVSPAANTTATLNYGTASAWTISADTTVGGIAFVRTGGGQNFTFSGTGVEVLTFSNTTTPVFATNSYFNGTTYWGDMVVHAASGLNLQTGFNNLVLTSGLSWDASSAGTLTFVQPASDGNIVYAQGNDVLAGTMDLNLGSGSKGSLLVINGGTTQTTGALSGTVRDYITAYSGTNSVFRNSVTPGGTNTVATSLAPVTLRIGATGSSATFAGVIGAQSGGNLAGTDTSAAAAMIDVVKLGAGTQTFTGANVYTGSTTISAGTLALSGTGSISSSTRYTIAAGATFDTSALTTPGYSLASIATTLDVDAATNGFINIGAGTLALGNSLTLNVTSLPTAASFDLYDAASVSGSFSSVTMSGLLNGSLSLSSGVWSGTVGGYDFALNEATGVLTASASAIPEPSTYATVFGALALGVVAIRRRNRKG